MGPDAGVRRCGGELLLQPGRSRRSLPPGVHLGIGLGRTVYQLVHSLDRISPAPKVVPLCGGTMFAESAYHVNEIARIAAQRLNGYCYYLHAPAEVSSRQVYEALVADSAVAEVISLWDRLDWALIGIGSAQHVESPEWQAYLQRTAQTGAQPVADLCYNLVDAEGGSVPPPPDASADADIEQLRRAMRRVPWQASGTEIDRSRRPGPGVIDAAHRRTDGGALIQSEETSPRRR